jgi:multicomponent Na+:H+ antiporter subunit G
MISLTITIVLLAFGTFFFVVGTIGLLRFPDVYTRLHALTKADNVGLGLIVAGLSLQAETWAGMGKLWLVWILTLTASSCACHLVAKEALNKGINPWKR